MYLDSVSYLKFKPCGITDSTLLSFISKETIQKLDLFAKDIFGNLEDINIYTLKFHTLDQATEDESRFELPIYLDASPHKHFSFVIRAFIRMASFKKSSNLK